MSFQWLKHYMPRGLYGRAALILLLPVVTLQLVVSVVFVQRHFEDVSSQMSRELAREIELTVAQPALAEPLALELITVPESALPAENTRRWYDFSGLVVTRTLERFVSGTERILLPDDDYVILYLRDGESLTQVRFSRRRASPTNAHQLFVNMMVFGVLMTVIAFLYLRNQLRPITELARAAEAFGRGRHEPYAPAGAVEVRAAGSAFLDMRNRIERQIEQRTMMLSGVSHDLRTPITRLKLGLSMLEDDEREPLERDVEDMQRLIDAFLDFARGDTQGGEAEPTDPFELVEGIVADARRAGKDVTVASTEGSGEVTLRPAAMRRALENLIGNAVRYGSRCEVSVALTEKSLRLRVEDDGPGIAPERREDALRPFVRLDPARNQDKGTGVGLGLAIAADIARAHGGVLRLGQSDSLGGLRADIVIAR
ncbi:MAG: two-component sensor histidine kinase [Rhodobacteraceae bacterium]|uniref:ATP-binding protein n=1 Tax=Salipiger thiooxidans TaxID=282683 RepID=UPI001A902B77|nr:ATP-binding protein [Salipiger thiooxidans]MBN8186399.1 two-component sensor histidine kinase [Salipiger thiooxidans]MBR9837073.1 two-component sensor histidine kinase [Paracoccaceae bacterium]